MWNGVCPVCQSTRIYTKLGGIVGFHNASLYLDASAPQREILLRTYICVVCGYVMLTVPPEELDALPQFLEDMDWQQIAVPTTTPRQLHIHDSQFFELVILNTLSVLSGPSTQRTEWYQMLKDYEHLAQYERNGDGVLFFQAIMGLLDTKGNPAGLGSQLRGLYAATWAEIVNSLP